MPPLPTTALLSPAETSIVFHHLLFSTLPLETASLALERALAAGGDIDGSVPRVAAALAVLAEEGIIGDPYSRLLLPYLINFFAKRAGDSNAEAVLGIYLEEKMKGEELEMDEWVAVEILSGRGETLSRVSAWDLRRALAARRPLLWMEEQVKGAAGARKEPYPGTEAENRRGRKSFLHLPHTTALSLATTLFSTIPSVTALRWRRPRQFTDSTHSSPVSTRGVPPASLLALLRYDYSACVNSVVLDKAVLALDVAITTGLRRDEEELVLNAIRSNPIVITEVLGPAERERIAALVEHNTDMTAKAIEMAIEAGVGSSYLATLISLPITLHVLEVASHVSRVDSPRLTEDFVGEFVAAAVAKCEQDAERSELERRVRLLAPRTYIINPIVAVRDDWIVRGLTIPQGVALAGLPRSAVQQKRLVYPGSYEPANVVDNSLYMLILTGPSY
ncbi:hypothetical protein HDU93_001290 [Gonapodya sp. JEL0774]|nr:hypothetical protein HDU93_001290 [Gonapodya sp. JEL0774]